MIEFWNSLDASNKIAFVSNIIAAFAILVSLGLGISSIYLTKKSIKSSCETSAAFFRPYVVIYPDVFTISKQETFFVIKNYGHLPATIVDFEYDDLLNTQNELHPLFAQQFKFIKNYILAPGQAKYLYYNFAVIPPDKLLTFKITYSFNENVYHDVFTVDCRNNIKIPTTGTPDNANEKTPHYEKVKNDLLYEIIKRLN